jgi:hypothetical protein
LRRSALYIVSGAWCVLAFAFLVAMLAIGIPVRVLAGDRAGRIVVAILAGASFFCLAGCASVLRRWYWYLPKARGGCVRVIGLVIRSTCGVRCRVFQSLVGILTVLIAI